VIASCHCERPVGAWRLLRSFPSLTMTLRDSLQGGGRLTSHRTGREAQARITWFRVAPAQVLFLPEGLLAAQHFPSAATPHPESLPSSPTTKLLCRK